MPEREPRPESAPGAFAAPWEAEAFALAVHLNARGHLSWGDFSAALGAELVNGDLSYYEAWVLALERVLEGAGAVRPDEIALRAEAWAQAYRETPHGRPVRLGGGGRGREHP